MYTKMIKRVSSLIILITCLSWVGMSGQPQPPGPGMPPPGQAPLPPGQNPPPPGPSGAPNTPPGWGSPGILMNPPTADWMNQGTLNVMATGYDSEGVMKQIPLYISYTFNGINYQVTVLNAWDPYTENWNIGIDMPAYSTSYYINGFNYNYYAPLSIGTFYFNL